MNLSSIYKIYFMFFIHFSNEFYYFPLMEIPFILCLCYYFLCRRGKNHFDVHFRRIGPVPLSVERWKKRGCEGKNGRKGVYFPQKSASFPFLKI